MKIVRLVSILLLTIIATVWTQSALFFVSSIPMLLPVLVLGMITLFPLIIMLLHKELFR